MDFIKVSSKTKPSSIAGTIAMALKNQPEVEIHSIGAGALNQAMKGIAIARGYVAPSGMDLYCIPAFLETKIDGEVKTALKLIIRYH